MSGAKRPGRREVAAAGLTLVLGGVSSGKSRFAAELAAAAGMPVVVVATGRASDPEMADRIARHRSQRPAAWTTIESVRDLAAAARPHAAGAAVLLEGVGGLVTESLLAGAEAPEAEAFACAEVFALESVCAHLIAVSDEVGSGLVSPHRLGRAFQDAIGRANQRLAAAAGRVCLCVAGLPIEVKPR